MRIGDYVSFRRLTFSGWQVGFGWVLTATPEWITVSCPDGRAVGGWDTVTVRAESVTLVSGLPAWTVAR